MLSRERIRLLRDHLGTISDPDLAAALALAIQELDPQTTIQQACPHHDWRGSPDTGWYCQICGKRVSSKELSTFVGAHQGER